jgi:GntR family transcriptional repressor for pyruvate dehydrogenase complex
MSVYQNEVVLVAGPAPLPNAMVAKREPPSLELARKLLDYLLSGEVRPGTRLPGERALSEALGVGRETLRGAIKSLSLLGILEQRQGDGTYLSSTQSSLLPKVIEWGLLLGENDIDSLLEARYHLEVTLAGLAAERRDEAALRRLRALIAEMKSCGDDHARYIATDIEFHLEIAAASGSSVLAGVLNNVRSLLQVWAERVITAAGETETSLAMHTPILAAIEAGDAEGARTAMRAHMDRAVRRLKVTMEKGQVASEAS